MVNVNFKWQGHCKPSSSMFVGTSPEFELALYTLCWFSRPNSRCPIKLGGHLLSVQTYEQVNVFGKKLVTAAYPVLSNASRIQNTILIMITFMFYIRHFLP